MKKYRFRLQIVQKVSGEPYPGLDFVGVPIPNELIDLLPYARDHANSVHESAKDWNQMTKEERMKFVKDSTDSWLPDHPTLEFDEDVKDSTSANGKPPWDISTDGGTRAVKWKVPNTPDVDYQGERILYKNVGVWVRYWVEFIAEQV